jgi:mannosyltransferase OCH1-like enzyme
MSFLINLLFIFFALQEAEGALKASAVPRVFHWIHAEETPLSKEHIYAIKSWQNAHPNWVFKIWTNGPVPLSRIKLCPITHVEQKDLETLRGKILQREGGVWVHSDLICCKDLEPLLAQQKGFISPGNLLIGCMPGGEAEWVLPEDFILPDQVFSTEIVSSPFSGVCFRKFSSSHALTEALYDIQGAKVKQKREQESFGLKIRKIKKTFLYVIALAFVNGLFCGVLWVRGGRRYFFLLLKIALPLCAILNFPWGMLHSTSSPPSQYPGFFHLSEAELCPSLTADDWHHLQIYNQLFLKYAEREENATAEPQIPRVIHFIWGGDQPFPSTSVQNVLSWIEHHPGWTIKFWTDSASRPPPVASMEKHLITELDFSNIEPYFSMAGNWGEKSDLLRYQILLNEGGVYVDHDIECFRSFESLHYPFSFYASLEPFHRAAFEENYVNITNCLIGSKPGHPILKKTLSQTAENWPFFTLMFPCEDKISVLLRTLGRTFYSFDKAVNAQLLPIDPAFIFPSGWIFPPKNPHSPLSHESIIPFADHKWDNTWFKDCVDLSSSTEALSKASGKLASLKQKLSNYLKWQIQFLSFIFLTLAYFGIQKRKTTNAKKIPMAA